MRIRFLLAVLAFLFAVPASAHSGGTDSQGGHHDYNNVSGLGSYHYHHGMGPHLHPNGVCPYSSGSSSGSSSSSSSSSSQPVSWEDTLIGWGYEYDEEMCIWKGWDGFYTEDREYYLWDDCGYCGYCEWPSDVIGHPSWCPYSDFYEEPKYAPDYCYDCDSIIESSSDHAEDCPALAPKYDFSAPVYDEEESEAIIQEAIGTNARESVKTDSETWGLLTVCVGLPAAAYIGYIAGKKR